MSAAPPLAALAVLLAFAAVRELRPGGVTRPRPASTPYTGVDAGHVRRTADGDGGARLLGLRRHRSAAAAALRLGLPDRLARAGLGARVPLGAVLMAKLAGAAAGALVALGTAPAAPGRTSLLVALGMPAAGFVLPDALLERAARLRRRRLLAALPDALDLLAIGSTAGRGPRAGFAEVARAGEGPLAEELRVTAAELSCGRPLPAALATLRARVEGGEIATLCASIERSRRLGSPLAEQLRRQASSLRRDQRRSLEERAARAAPKIQLVVALVLVPSVLLMIAAALIANAGLLLGGF